MVDIGKGDPSRLTHLRKRGDLIYLRGYTKGPSSKISGRRYGGRSAARTRQRCYGIAMTSSMIDESLQIICRCIFDDGQNTVQMASAVITESRCISEKRIEN